MLGYGNNAGSSNNHTSTVKPVKLGRRMNDKRSLQLFRNVIFVLDDLLPQGIKSNVSEPGKGSKLDRQEGRANQHFLCIASKYITE